ncbi:MAG TPA: fumarylacetoacetate hydrolase family protein [Burkholderiales bacterium]|jgi:2-keto-4-pentenoate hydratase|nr:fumarylacetoacetate hydrolase family protein [Burkholderiales bacterium]
MVTIGAARVRNSAQWLVERHRARHRPPPLPAAYAPRSIGEAYAMQEAFVALKARACGPIVGYKIALTTPQMRRFVGLQDSIAGCLHARQVVRAPASVRAADYGRLLVEFEIALVLGSDIAPKGAAHTPHEVAAAVGAVMPAFELADDLGADYATLGSRGLELAADNAWNEGAVLGQPVEDWHAIDLASVRGVARVNGRIVGEGRGADAMGSPLVALAWIANHLRSRGRSLRKGDIVITGSLVASQFPRAGDVLQFDAGPLGAIELTVN